MGVRLKTRGNVKSRIQTAAQLRPGQTVQVSLGSGASLQKALQTGSFGGGDVGFAQAPGSRGEEFGGGDVGFVRAPGRPRPAVRAGRGNQLGGGDPGWGNKNQLGGGDPGWGNKNQLGGGDPGWGNKNQLGGGDPGWGNKNQLGGGDPGWGNKNQLGGGDPGWGNKNQLGGGDPGWGRGERFGGDEPTWLTLDVLKSNGTPAKVSIQPGTGTLERLDEHRWQLSFRVAPGNRVGGRLKVPKANINAAGVPIPGSDGINDTSIPIPGAQGISDGGAVLGSAMVVGGSLRMIVSIQGR